MANVDRVITFRGHNGEGGINAASVLAGEQLLTSASDLSAETYVALIASAST